MKWKLPNKILFILFVLSFSMATLNSQNNVITLKSTPNGSEGNSKFTDNSTIFINSSGVASYQNTNQYDDWTVSSTTVTPSGAKNKSFNILFGGMATTDTNVGIDYGKLLTAGGIDRANNGALGIKSSNGNGINNNEGYTFGLDLTNISYTASLQFSKIYVSWTGSANETGVIVSRSNTSKQITFGNKTGVDVLINNNNEHSIDVTSLNIYLAGGEVNDSLLAVFNNSSVTNNFRVTGVEFKVVTNILNPAVISNHSHPRILLEQGEESQIQTLINQSSNFSKLHDHIVEKADEFVTAPSIVLPSSGRFLSEAREALRQIFYMSYAYRMTNNSSYLTKVESVLNTISNFNSWKISGSQDLETAEMCMAAAIGYDWLFDDLSSSTKQNVREAILNFGLKPLKDRPFWDATSNWNQVGIAGVTYGAIAIYNDGTTEMDSEAKDVLKKILAKNPNSMNTYADGNYAEGPMYWNYGSTFEVMLLSALEKLYGTNHTDIKRLTNSPGFLESAEFMQFATGPTSLYFNYMDGTDKRKPLPVAFWMAKKMNNPDVLSEEKKLLANGIYFESNDEDRCLPLTMIYAKDINIDNLNNPAKKLFVGHGHQPVALVRTSWAGSTGKFFGIKAGTADYSHGHMDAGTFVYDSQGIRWGMDFGKYDYGAVTAGIFALNPNNWHSNRDQNSARWDIFRVSNLNNNTLSIKKTSENNWQHYNVDGFASIIETYDTNAKRGAKVDLTSVIGLNNELHEIKRSVYLVNEDYLEIKDEVNNGSQSVDLYWNMVTDAQINQINSSKIKLTKEGKSVILELQSSNSNVSFSLVTNRSTDPVDYFSTATYERKNPGTTMIGFTSTIPANENVTYTVTLKDDAKVQPSSSIGTNEILLDLPDYKSHLEGNNLYKTSSIFHIDNSGDVDITGYPKDYAWIAHGNTNITNANNSSFNFSFNVIGETGGIDRNNSGYIGIRGENGGGIDPEEGFRLGLSAIQMPSNVSLQLTKISFKEVSNNRKGIISGSTLSKTFGANGVTADVNLSGGFVNVDDLNIIVQGGAENNDLATVQGIGNATGGFRINKFVFKVIPTTSSKSLNTESNSLENIQLYPNPFNDFITIKGLHKKTAESVNYKLYDLLGSCLINHKVDKKDITNELKIPLNNLTKGVYFLKVEIGEHNSIKKIIKTD
jgi:hypothetical protein